MRDGRQVVVVAAATCTENELAFQSQMGVLKWLGLGGGRSEVRDRDII